MVEDQNSLAKNEDASSTRQEMLQMGNSLVELTDQILKHSQKFLKSFNKQFAYVKLESIIFQEADYLEVAIKEVEEIGKIFASYEIQMKVAKLVVSYVRGQPLAPIAFRGTVTVSRGIFS